MTSSVFRAAVQRAVAGDVRSVADLRAFPQGHFPEEALTESLIVGRESVARVLRGIECREIGGQEAQGWASFIRRGFISGKGGGPVRPLTIEYESDYEDAIADVISRLDEIGDLVDGDLPSEGEIADYLASLGLADNAGD
jgi:hypothetical protein